MASGTITAPQRLKRITKAFTNISGSANTNIYLSNDVATDLGYAYDRIVNIVPASDAGFGGGVWNIFHNTTSIYIKSTTALSNATVNIYAWVIDP